jgi:hypothetical protein
MYFDRIWHRLAELVSISAKAFAWVRDVPRWIFRALFPADENAWQEYCTAELRRCVDLEKQAVGTGQAEWSRMRRILAKKRKVVIADGKFAKASLKGFDFIYCYLIRTDFTLADLTGCRFKQAVLRDCKLNQARVDQADLSLTDVRGSELNVITPVDNIIGVRPFLAETLRNHQYRADAHSANRNLLLRGWNKITNFGNSLFRLLLGSVLTIGFFATVYYWLQESFSLNVLREPADLWGLLAFSTEAFLNAAPGFNDQNALLTWIVIANICFGIGALGLFIAILSRKLITFIQ